MKKKNAAGRDMQLLSKVCRNMQEQTVSRNISYDLTEQQTRTVIANLYGYAMFFISTLSYLFIFI